MICILIWLGIAATLIRPFFIHQFPYGGKPARAGCALFVALVWPYAVFMTVRKAFLYAVLS